MAGGGYHPVPSQPPHQPNPCPNRGSAWSRQYWKVGLHQQEIHLYDDRARLSSHCDSSCSKDCTAFCTMLGGTPGTSGIGNSGWSCLSDSHSRSMMATQLSLSTCSMGFVDSPHGITSPFWFAMLLVSWPEVSSPPSKCWINSFWIRRESDVPCWQQRSYTTHTSSHVSESIPTGFCFSISSFVGNLDAKFMASLIDHCSPSTPPLSPPFAAAAACWAGAAWTFEVSWRLHGGHAGCL